jgi:hypothetical protein
VAPLALAAGQAVVPAAYRTRVGGGEALLRLHAGGGAHGAPPLCVGLCCPILTIKETPFMGVWGSESRRSGEVRPRTFNRSSEFRARRSAGRGRKMCAG